MPATDRIPDAAARARALDPTASFIVQAPAGSGKTGLLIQRLLALLARADQPEEVVAITFTRKAAAEMRARVLEALDSARADGPVTDGNAALTRQLSKAVLARDAERGWGLAQGSPGRLRLLTIDALCAQLVRRLPVLSGFGARPEPVDDSEPLYREAARATLGAIDSRESAAAGPLRVLLGHRNNDHQGLEALLVKMLARRDQWLRVLLQAGEEGLQREVLEQALRDALTDALEELCAHAPAALGDGLLAVARAAAANLEAEGKADFAPLRTITHWPGATLDDRAAWECLAQLALTKEGAVRADGGVNAKIGFPAPSTTKDKAEKARRAALKADLAALLAELRELPAFTRRLHAVRGLPPPSYPDAHWAVVEALVSALPVAAAQLELVFGARGQVDFTQVSQAALRALGSDEDPTDLALALDHRLRHVLVDEFQDTSVAQVELLERLVAGWQPGDGRTLFLVGDPMQSIYRFREADVALYLRARARGVGDVPLEPLLLEANFRSRPGIVAWVNETFARVLPAEEDMDTAAVPHAPSVAVRPQADGEAVVLHPLTQPDAETEARLVAQLVAEGLALGPDASVAILVRSRSQLSAIVPQLRGAGLAFQAVDIDPLGSRPVVQDLHMLTRALLHPADRLAWLAVLRAPWCGLRLADLEALAHAAPTLWEAMKAAPSSLSADGLARVAHARAALGAFVEARGRVPVSARAEGAWLALGGPAAAGADADLTDACHYFELLANVEEAGDVADFATLAERVTALFAPPDPQADGRLQVMTMHKAKGLEFDTVILPGLGAGTRGDEKPLLRWHLRPRHGRGADLLLAPLASSGGEHEPVGDWLAGFDKARAAHEMGRLLYVAATRARERLHLIGHARRHADGTVHPRAGSLLESLWPAVQGRFDQAMARVAAAAPVAPAPAAAGAVVRRLVLPWTMPDLPGRAGGGAPAPVAAELPGVEFSWASETARHVGSVVHAVLQHMAEEGIEHWTPVRVESMGAVFERRLQSLGVPAAQRPVAGARVRRALAEALADPRARWILGPHAEARCEWRLTGVLDGALVDVALDRTFVDEDGTRWIVDYKTGLREGGDAEGFLDQERERYRPQLERYARLLRELEDRPVRCGLYFPLMRGWREW
ncbi:MAG: UvrD-helicase domain-containing protein [Betaproteobacteria bacterium]|jgi:ATP-dependent helicase/nuclease subunit A|nr:UvrD-helicase domain-containing protein [Betaproteobacteria bacterium]